MVISSLALVLLWVLAGPILHNVTLLKLLFREDRLVENISAIVLLYASIKGIIALKKRKVMRLNASQTFPSKRTFFWLLPVFSFWSFLEEVSFGRNFIKLYERPRVLEKPIDTTHDFVEVGMRFVQQHPHAGVILAGSVALLFLVGLLFFYTLSNNLS